MAEGERFVDKKIAILGGSTTNDIKLILELFLLNQGIRPSFYESEYNKYYEDAVFDNAELEAFAPDLIYIHTSNRNITCYPQMSDSKSQITDLLEAEYQKYCTIWESIADRYHCPIIQNNFEMPMYRLMGNRDASDRHGKVNFLTRLNMMFYDYADGHEDFYICDINYISADYGLAEWSDPFFYHMYKYALNVNAIPYLAFNVANIIMDGSAYIDQQIDQKRVMQSVFATAQLGWKESLYLDLTARNDWSSALAYTDGYPFFYPSAGASLLLNRFVDMGRNIDLFKFRGSYSIVGNDVPVYKINPR